MATAVLVTIKYHNDHTNLSATNNHRNLDVRYHICYISSFILMNFTRSVSRESAVRNKALLIKWRNILRTQSGVWPLAKLATIRLDAALWKGLPFIVHGIGPNSPAFQLVNEETAGSPGER